MLIPQLIVLVLQALQFVTEALSELGDLGLVVSLCAREFLCEHLGLSVVVLENVHLAA